MGLQYQGILLAVNLSILIIAYLLLKGKPDKLKLIFITTIFAYFLAGILPYLLNWIASKWIIIFYAIAIAVALIVIDFILTDNIIEGLENDKIDILASDLNHSNIGSERDAKDLLFDEHTALSSKLSPRIGSRHQAADGSKPGPVQIAKPVEKEEDANQVHPGGIVINLAAVEKIEEKKSTVSDKIKHESVAFDFRQGIKDPSTPSNANEPEKQPSSTLFDNAQPEGVLDRPGLDFETADNQFTGVEDTRFESVEAGAEQTAKESAGSVIEDDISEVEPSIVEDTGIIDDSIIQESAPAPEETVDQVEETAHEAEADSESVDSSQEESTESPFNEDALSLLDIDDLIDIAFQAKFKDDYRAAIRIFELVLRRNPAPKLASLIVEDLEIMQSKIA